MKSILSIIILFVLCCSVSAQEEFKPLFNGKNLDGWHSTRDEATKGSGAFSVNKGEKSIHVYAGKEAGSKQDIDCLFSQHEYSHYVLKLEYKWMDKRFPPRVSHDRDAGLLFHLHGDVKKIWPNCLEMQLGESDATKLGERYTTGDLWVIGKDVQVINTREGDFYVEGATPVSIGKNRAYDQSFTQITNEKPHGEWNEITLTVRGGKEAIFELNGKVVNRITDMTYLVDGKRVPLEKGRIGLQAEFAELMYRNIRIKELTPIAEQRVHPPEEAGTD